jgi:hypothetical protein
MDRGLPVELEVQVLDAQAAVLVRREVRLDRPVVVPLPVGAASVVLDPSGHAPVRLLPEQRRWKVP